LKILGLFQGILNVISRIFLGCLLTSMVCWSCWMLICSKWSLCAKPTAIAYLLTLYSMLSYVDIKYCFNQLPERLKLVDLKVECLFLLINTCKYRRFRNPSKNGENTYLLHLTNHIYSTVYTEIQILNLWMYWIYLILH
jgi:hypothetical protein